MTKKEYRKLSDGARRVAAKEAGFGQSGYVNWKVEEGYYFALFDLGEKHTYITVKPVYLDELWSDIDTDFDFRKLPMSLRACGISARAQQLIKYFQRPPEQSDIEGLPKMWKDIFADISLEIKKFLADNPDADKFMFDVDKLHQDFSRISYMLCLMHHGRHSEVIELIAEDRKVHSQCNLEVRRVGDKQDAYDKILDYYVREGIIHKRKARKLYSTEDATYRRLRKLLPSIIPLLRRGGRK